MWVRIVKTIVIDDRNYVVNIASYQNEASKKFVDFEHDPSALL